MAGAAVKASRDVRAGEVISARTGDLLRTVKVLAPIERRVGPKMAGEAMEDLTPAEEYLRAMRARDKTGAPHRPKGAGRPTKKDRRDLERMGGEQPGAMGFSRFDPEA